MRTIKLKSAGSGANDLRYQLSSRRTWLPGGANQLCRVGAGSQSRKQFLRIEFRTDRIDAELLLHQGSRFGHVGEIVHLQFDPIVVGVVIVKRSSRAMVDADEGQNSLLLQTL